MIRDLGLNTVGLLFGLVLCTTAFSAPSDKPPIQPPSTRPPVSPLQKPDLLLYGCYKNVVTPAGTPPNKVQIELNLVIQNVGLYKSNPTKVNILFNQANRTLTYDVPELPYGSYGSTKVVIQGKTHWTGKNTYHLKKTITPYEDILPLDLSNGLTATVTLDPDNQNAETKEDNNVTDCDFSLGA